MGRASATLGRTCWLWLGAAALTLSGCGPTRLTVKPTIPPLLVTPLPLAMGVRIPKSFAEYVQKDKGQDREWQITLGPGQADAIRRVTAAMFEHTVVLGDQSAGDAATIAAHKLNAIIETSLDSYVYLLPSPGGADYYSATIGYKVNLLSVDGTVLGSWIYEGYGSAPSRNLGSAKGVALVSGLAIRDACANLAVHLRDQELVRNLLTPNTSVPAPTPPPADAEKSPPGTKPVGDEKPSPGTKPAGDEVPPPGRKPAGDEKPSPDTKPAADATPASNARSAADPVPDAGAKPGADSPPAHEATPGAESPVTPAPAPSTPETPPAPNAVEVQPTTGN